MDTTSAGHASDAEASMRPDRPRTSPVAQFAVKTIIVTLAITVSAWIILDQVFDRVNSALDQRIEQIRFEIHSATKIGGRSFWASLEGVLDAAAAPGNDPPPEVKQKILGDLQILADRWRPVLRDGMAILAGEAPGSAVRTGPKIGADEGAK
jgi:hypothetical protein